MKSQSRITGRQAIKARLCCKNNEEGNRKRAVAAGGGDRRLYKWIAVFAHNEAWIIKPGGPGGGEAAKEQIWGEWL